MKWFALLPLLAMAAVEGPQQPIPYSHKQHVSLGLKCTECHTMPDPGEMMTFPATSKCMACHRTVKSESEAIKKLAAFAVSKQDVPWVRVYQIPSYVFFSHRAHLDTGATCETCHGAVATRDRLFKEKEVSMGSCMDCHRANRASLECNFCHDTRQ